MRISDWSSDVCSSDLMVQAPKTRWSDIGGLDAARDKLIEGIELPLKNPAAFRRLGIRPAKGFLLYGPPGTGKTLLAKAAARESDANRSETRRVGKEGVSTFRSRWVTYS